ncbi:hypothetical protein [Massilia niabensis]|uniref:Uncharacterized protein n=1 Tax=Massilia niabensis TaxID=544910 RepID=A0ABW0L8N0_9BURK
MQSSLSRSQVFLMLCAGAVLVILNLDTGTSNSIDLAHHYALAFRIAQDWHLAPGDITLGEMNFYPRLSHVGAAAVGMVLNSTFMGIQVTALAAVALVWGALIYILHTLPARLALAATALLAGLLWANQALLGLDVHGSEIVGNFFYSQLVGQGLTLLAMAVAIHLEAARGRVHAAVFLVAAIYAIAGVHLLPALELLGMLCVVQLLQVLAADRPWRARGPAIGAALLCMAAGLAAVLLNPAFAAMRKISEINGNLTLVLVSGKTGLVVLSLAAIAAAAVLLRLWYRERDTVRALKFLGAYGATIALLCLLQLALLRFGFGSDYAVKKYAFGLTSFLFVAAAVLGARLAFGPRGGARAPGPYAGIAATVVPVAALAIAFACCARWAKLTDTSDIVALERQLAIVQAGPLAPAAGGKANVVVDLRDQPWTINYLFSIALARTPRDLAMQRVLGTNDLGPLDQYDTILSSRGASRYEFAGCARPGSGRILLIDAACTAKVIAASSACKRVVDFSERGDIVPSMLRGFSWPHPQGRWTDGPRATFSCVAGERHTRARIVLAPYLERTHQRQRVAITVNGGAPVQSIFEGAVAPRTLDLALPPVEPGTTLEFVIETPDAVSPQQLGVNGDGRRLGVDVRTLSFE